MVRNRPDPPKSPFRCASVGSLASRQPSPSKLRFVAFECEISRIDVERLEIIERVGQARRVETAERILRQYSTWAVVGLSRDPSKAAARVPATLQAHGFRIVPINPTVSGELLDEKVYASLRDIPFPIDVVLVFRPAAEAPAIARDAVAIGAHALWLQLGIESEEAAEIADEAGLAFVQDRCSAVERSIHDVARAPRRS